MASAASTPSGPWAASGCEPEQAVEFLLEALSKSPSDGYVSFQLGTAYAQLGRDQEAERLLTLGSGATRPTIGDNLSRELSGYAKSRSARIAQATSLIQGNEIVALQCQGTVLMSADNAL